MPLNAETGLIVAGADSYVSEAEALAYHAKMGNVSWALISSSLQEIYLRKAARWLDASYNWIGYISNKAQHMRWPRREHPPTDFGSVVECPLYDRDRREINAATIPQAVKDAQCEAALLIAAAGGADLVGGAAGGPQTAAGAVRRLKADAVEIEYEPRGAAALASSVTGSGALGAGQGELIDRILAGLYRAPALYRAPLVRS